MPTTRTTHGGIVIDRFRLAPRRRRGAALLTAVFAMGLIAGPTATRAANLTIGNVATFNNATGSAPATPWRLGDKDFTFLKASSNWNGNEIISLTSNVDPQITSHEFLISNLGSYTSPVTLALDYKVEINGIDGPGWFFSKVTLDSTTTDPIVQTWKDVFDSEAGYLASTGHTGVGPGQWHLSGLNGVPDSAIFPSGLKKLWVRDTIQLSSGGRLSSVNNTFRQAVPEIDRNAFGSALAVAIGALALLERRARQMLGLASAA